ncbi:hypothetical protein F0235_06110 [Vibrio splendidus]|nr:hypothetical protein [Vibrio splendidus]
MSAYFFVCRLRKEIKSRHGKIKADAGFEWRDAKRFKSGYELRDVKRFKEQIRIAGCKSSKSRLGMR